MPTSSEFIALCRAQVTLLTQGLGASLSVVYLTQRLVEGGESRLVPVVAHPEHGIDWEEPFLLQFPYSESASPMMPRLLANPTPTLMATAEGAVTQNSNSEIKPLLDPSAAPAPSVSTSSQESSLVPQRQLVLPLIHEEVVLGFLVVGRDDRGWDEWEQSQVEQIADTLAIACVLDQRYQWLEHERQQERLVQRQQRDLLDNLLHQFRNSLTALQTFGKLILKRLLPNDANQDIAASIVRETARLRDLSQQLEAITGAAQDNNGPLALPSAAPDWRAPRVIKTTASDENSSLARLAGRSSLSVGQLLPEAYEIAAVLTPLLTSAQSIAQDRNLRLHTHIPIHLPTVWVNAQALHEVLNNLLENALKYTPSGGEIWVEVTTVPPSASTEAVWIEIAISDTGPGIPPQDLPHLFERRYRGVQAQTQIPGSGLGLAIAKALIEQMQGEIQVLSPARNHPVPADAQPVTSVLGPGATFIVRLPTAATEVSQESQFP